MRFVLTSGFLWKLHRETRFLSETASNVFFKKHTNSWRIIQISMKHSKWCLLEKETKIYGWWVLVAMSMENCGSKPGKIYGFQFISAQVVWEIFMTGTLSRQCRHLKVKSLLSWIKVTIGGFWLSEKIPEFYVDLREK